MAVFYGWQIHEVIAIMCHTVFFRLGWTGERMAFKSHFLIGQNHFFRENVFKWRAIGMHVLLTVTK